MATAKQIVKNADYVIVLFGAEIGSVSIRVTKSEALRLIDEYELESDWDGTGEICGHVTGDKVAAIHFCT